MLLLLPRGSISTCGGALDVSTIRGVFGCSRGVWVTIHVSSAFLAKLQILKSGFVLFLGCRLRRVGLVRLEMIGLLCEV